MPKETTSLVGKKFGRLTVLDNVGKNHSGQNLWRCQCDCGTETIVITTHLKRGLVQSCGCLRRDVARDLKTIHGHRGERLYEIWKSMNARCSKTNHTSYHKYGGRGISVCDEWKMTMNRLKSGLYKMGILTIFL